VGPRSTVPVSAPLGAGRCLDYVLSVAPDARLHPGVQSGALVLGTPDADGIYPSDHRGVLVILTC
jgi:hypothetical protein